MGKGNELRQTKREVKELRPKRMGKGNEKQKHKKKRTKKTEEESA